MVAVLGVLLACPAMGQSFVLEFLDPKGDKDVHLKQDLNQWIDLSYSAGAKFSKRPLIRNRDSQFPESPLSDSNYFAQIDAAYVGSDRFNIAYRGLDGAPRSVSGMMSRPIVHEGYLAIARTLILWHRWSRAVPCDGKGNAEDRKLFRETIADDLKVIGAMRFESSIPESRFKAIRQDALTELRAMQASCR
jgi:hypothetical protein